MYVLTHRKTDRTFQDYKVYEDVCGIATILDKYSSMIHIVKWIDNYDLDIGVGIGFTEPHLTDSNKHL